MLSKGSLTVLPAVTDNVNFNVGLHPASQAVAGSSAQTNYLYVSPNLVFNPATNQLVFNSSVVFGNSATYANGASIGTGSGGAGSGTSGGTSVTISDTPPTNPSPGNLWWNSVLGTMFIYYYNGTSYQWVTSSPALVGAQGVQGPTGPSGYTGSIGVSGGATGSGTDTTFFVNGQTANTSYSIPSGKSAMSVGPLTIANGVTITIPSGSKWVIL